jgi:hypothetical protein
MYKVQCLVHDSDKREVWITCYSGTSAQLSVEAAKVLQSKGHKSRVIDVILGQYPEVGPVVWDSENPILPYWVADESFHKPKPELVQAQIPTRVRPPWRELVSPKYEESRRAWNMDEPKLPPEVVQQVVDEAVEEIKPTLAAEWEAEHMPDTEVSIPVYVVLSRCGCPVEAREIIDKYLPQVNGTSPVRVENGPLELGFFVENRTTNWTLYVRPSFTGLVLKTLSNLCWFTEEEIEKEFLVALTAPYRG